MTVSLPIQRCQQPQSLLREHIKGLKLLVAIRNDALEANRKRRERNATGETTGL